MPALAASLRAASSSAAACSSSGRRSPAVLVVAVPSAGRSRGAAVVLGRQGSSSSSRGQATTCRAAVSDYNIELHNGPDVDVTGDSYVCLVREAASGDCGCVCTTGCCCGGACVAGSIAKHIIASPEPAAHTTKGRSPCTPRHTASTGRGAVLEEDGRRADRLRGHRAAQRVVAGVPRQRCVRTCVSVTRERCANVVQQGSTKCRAGSLHPPPARAAPRPTLLLFPGDACRLLAQRVAHRRPHFVQAGDGRLVRGRHDAQPRGHARGLCQRLIL